MATDKQILANQRNAQKSTGPRTAEGKGASCRNALTHGLSARKAIVLEDESETEFLALKHALQAHFAPANPVARMLVETLAAHFWRLQRIPKFEVLLLEAGPATPEGAHPEGAHPEEAALAQATPEGTTTGGADAHEDAAEDPAVGGTPDRSPAVIQLEALRSLFLPEDVFGKLSRHEAHLLREIHKILRVLGPGAASRPATSPTPLMPPAPSATVPPASLPYGLDTPLDTQQRILQSMRTSS